MEKTSKFTDEKFLEAVIKCADEYGGKMENGKLARWVTENIEGAEGVEDRCFGRHEEKNDTKTSKQIKKEPRMVKIHELYMAINTMKAIANEINDMYQNVLADEEFKKWFPVFFWTRVTFVNPLHATEMLVTPFDCIWCDESGRITITLRRAMLKGEDSMVRYAVERDYEEIVYELPDNWVVEVIERYQQLTSDHPRSFLFDHTKYMVNNSVSLYSFNTLLADFIETRLIGNPEYDYARYETGMKAFEYVTAEDSWLMAMANLIANGK